MSLNRVEHLLFEYIDKHPEERQYWLYKVRDTAKLALSLHQAAEHIDADLWHYFKERAAVVPMLREFVQRYGLARTSMKNLAEYFLRIWAPQNLTASEQQKKQDARRI